MHNVIRTICTGTYLPSPFHMCASIQVEHASVDTKNNAPVSKRLGITPLKSLQSQSLNSHISHQPRTKTKSRTSNSYSSIPLFSSSPPHSDAPFTLAPPPPKLSYKKSPHLMPSRTPLRSKTDATIVLYCEQMPRYSHELASLGPRKRNATPAVAVTVSPSVTKVQETAKDKEKKWWTDTRFWYHAQRKRKRTQKEKPI
jgi:hypothetical protein